MVFYRKGRITNAITLQEIRETNGEDFVSRHGSGLLMGTRAILLRSLLEEALKKTEEDDSPVEIEYGADVIDYVSPAWAPGICPVGSAENRIDHRQDRAMGTVLLHDRRKMQGDIVIGADGLHSRATRHVVEFDSKPSPNGVSAFRFVVPTERLESIEGIEKVFTPKEGAVRHSIDMKGRIMVWSRSHEWVAALGF